MRPTYFYVMGEIPVVTDFSWGGQIDSGDDPRPRDLRDQIKALGDKLKERDDQIAKMEARIRSQDVGSILSSKLGLDPRIADLIPDSVEPTEAALKTWTETYGDLFAKPATSTEGGEEGKQGEGDQQPANNNQQTQAPNLTPEQIAAFVRFQTQEASAGTTSPDMEAQQLAQLDAARAAANGSSDRFFEILKSGQAPQPTA